jgi:hypothetical protein
MACTAITAAVASVSISVTAASNFAYGMVLAFSSAAAAPVFLCFVFMVCFLRVGCAARTTGSESYAAFFLGMGLPYLMRVLAPLRQTMTRLPRS